MLRLWSRFSREPTSLDIQLVKCAVPAEWDQLRQRVMALMKLRHCYDSSIDHLRDTPYQLWQGRNYMSETFQLLHFKTDMKRYVEIEQENENESHFAHFVFPEIVNAFETLQVPLRYIVMEMDLSENVQPVAPPAKMVTTSAMVDAAFEDAEMLIRTRGAAHGLDRMHLMLHAYLKGVCIDENITYEDESSVSRLFWLLKKNHRQLQIGDRESRQAMQKILGGLTQIIDASNPVRNSKSMAHPNELLSDPEAILVLNAMRSLLHYLDKRLAPRT